MGIDLRKTNHVLFFIIFLPGISFGIGWIFSIVFPNVPFWIETISPLAAYGIIYGLFEKHAWHWRIFRMTGIVRSPDIRGRWLGEQLSSYKDANGKLRKSRVIMEVEQTFSTIKVTTFYKYWQTEHTIASFINADDECVLFVMFETAPKVEYNGDAAAHKGVMRLAQELNKTLTGTYFNAEGRSGELTFKRTGFALRSTFDSTKNN